MQSAELGALTRELMAKDVPDAPDGDVSDLVAQLGWRRTGASMLVTALWQKACRGDVSAAKLIREMNGENPCESETVDLSAISDAALMRMAREGGL